MKKHLLAILSLLVISTYVQAQTSYTDFDKANGANTYSGGLNDGNWIDNTEASAAPINLPVHAGTQALMSGNGNTTGSFPDLGIEKNLGGLIEDKTYTVSFYIATYGVSSGVAFSDFTTLYIGGAEGSTVWTSTATPVSGQWVKWTGTYTPDGSEIGQPFIFKAVFDLKAKTSIAIDGVIGIEQAQTFIADFDKTPGDNTYFGGLNDDNWIDNTEASAAPINLPVHAGTQALMSGNGNTTGSFPDLGIEKNLGGSIEDKTYTVSFYIATYGVSSGIAFSDFTTLYIGGAEGSTVWTSTATPVSGQWVKWTGTYTPALSEVGQQFMFKAIFDLKAKTSIAIDGTIDIVSGTTTATTSHSNMNDVSVYPNPFNENLTIDLSKNSDYSSVEIFNVAGEKIHTIDTSLTIATWNGVCSNGTVAPNGLYTLLIQKDGATIVKRIILNRVN
jgi:hypothetical protein